MKNIKLIGFPALALAAVLSISSCKQKEDPAPAPVNGSMKFEFTNQSNGVALKMDNWYVNAASDSFKLTAYKYYVSNMVLHKSDGSTYTVRESYHLVDQDLDASRKFTIADVPAGDYNKATFLIGVDSLHNTTGSQAGDLDPKFGMIWDWNTGYIMAKMEGIAKNSPNPGNGFAFHISGFQGPNKGIRSVTITFPNMAIVSGANIPNVHVFAEIQEWFKNPNTIDFANYYDVMEVGAKSKAIADNYQDMFKVDHVDN